MTFLTLQTRVMTRLNLSSTEARTRIKGFLNERYRRMVTSTGLGQVRLTEVSQATVAGTQRYSPTVIKVLTVTLPALDRTLTQRTLAQIRQLDPAGTQEGAPYHWVSDRFTATSNPILLWPTPDDIYTLKIDGLAAGTDMSLDADVPALPEDFHDALVFGATADELDKMEKPDAAMKKEGQFEARVRDLRYFLAKSAWLGQQQGSDVADAPWWLGPFGGPFGWSL